MITLIQKLEKQQPLSCLEFTRLLQERDDVLSQLLAQKACAVRDQVYGRKVYVRGLIEFTNCCKCDCYYCGLRRSNTCVRRYRLNQDEILSCCQLGFDQGIRTFVLQGGEDPWYTTDRIARLVRAIKAEFPQCAVTLSVGEHTRQAYQTWFDAGADRYLLRHETADPVHFAQLHPESQTLDNRLACLKDLKNIGYQVGCGFMVGSPGQGVEQLVQDLLWIQQFRPHMVGIGSFIPQKDTPFGEKLPGSVELTCYLLSLVRLMLPDVLLPATTALGTIHPKGRELGFQSGANVCMPNLSPPQVRADYALYDNKLSTGAEALSGLLDLEKRVNALGYSLCMERGDHASRRKERIDHV